MASLLCEANARPRSTCVHGAEASKIFPAIVAAGEVLLGIGVVDGGNRMRVASPLPIIAARRAGGVDLGGELIDIVGAVDVFARGRGRAGGQRRDDFLHTADAIVGVVGNALAGARAPPRRCTASALSAT